MRNHTQQATHLAHQLLMQDPETKEELFPCEEPKSLEDGSFQIVVTNAARTRKWKHTICTEEV